MFRGVVDSSRENDRYFCGVHGWFIGLLCFGVGSSIYLNWYIILFWV